MKIRKREAEISNKYKKNKLKFDESTYHFSSAEKEDEFIKMQFPTPEEMKRYRKYREEWHSRSDSMDPGDHPLAVICELVSSCNLTCEMCYTRTPRFQQSVVGLQNMLPWDIVTKIIDECAETGVYSLLFSWRGESTLYRSKGSDGKWHDFADVLEYARSRGILERTSLTNGRALKDGLIKKIIEAQPSWISFSVDGLGDDYNKIRTPNRIVDNQTPFELVMNNIKKMVRLRDELGYTRPQIRTNTIYPAIAKHAEEYRETMEKAGVGLVTINEMLDYRDEELPEDTIMDDWFCQYPFQRLTVAASGIILPCPGTHSEADEIVLGRYKGVQDKKTVVDGQTKILKYPEVSLIEAWNSDTLNNLRSLHKNSRRKEIKVCKYCRHGVEKHGIKWIPEDWDMEKMEWVDRVWRQG